MLKKRAALQSSGITVVSQGFAAFGLIALATAGFDLLTKQLVWMTMAGTGSHPLIGALSLKPLFNLGSAGGVSVGPYTWQLNVMLTLAALALITSVATSLIAVDRRATLALGLVAGGALGNLASMLAGPEGVADFLALRIHESLTIVMNAADVALWLGALGLLPVVVSLMRAIRAERRNQRLSERAARFRELTGTRLRIR